MGEDYDYKDIYDFDLTKFEEGDDYYDGLEDNIIIEKNFTEEELENFKNKVKKYCEEELDLVDDYEDDLSDEEFAERIYMNLEDRSGSEKFSETILEEFYGQQDLFFEYAKEVALEIAYEYKEKRHERAKNEIKSKIEEILKKSFFRSDALSDIIELLEKNETYKTIDDPDIIRKFISREPRKLDSYIPSEILEYIDLKLIQEDDEFMEDILNCWIAPEKYLAGLKEGIGYTIQSIIIQELS